MSQYCTCGGQAWYPREVDADGNAHGYCEKCGKQKDPNAVTPEDAEWMDAPLGPPQEDREMVERLIPEAIVSSGGVVPLRKVEE